MWRVLQDAVINYRDEAENLLIIVAPAVVLGPVLVIFASSGLRSAFATIPAFLLLYLLTYAACIRAAGLLRNGLPPEPWVAYLDAVRRAPGVLRAAAPGGLLLAMISGGALALSDLGYFAPMLVVSLVGALAVFLWGRGHAYDQALILVHGVDATEAASLRSKVTGGNMLWTALLLTVVSAPLLAALLFTWGLAAALTPPSGAVVFAMALALWLPLLALSVTAASEELFGRAPV